MVQLIVTAAILLMLASSGVATDAVRLLPASRRVTTPHGTAAFTCYASQGNFTAVQWKLNNTRAEEFNQAYVDIQFIEMAVGNLGSLVLRHIPVEWNETRVHCEATFESGTTLTSERCTLILQGLLAPVGLLNISTTNTSVTITWTAPFTFNFMRNGPDITYCVDVVQNTQISTALWQATTVQSECGIQETNYTFVFLFTPSICDEWEFIVTPVNPAGNGTRSILTSDGHSELFLANVLPPPVFSSDDIIVTFVETNTIRFSINTSTLTFLFSAEVLDPLLNTRRYFDASNGLSSHRTGSISHLTLTTSELPPNKVYMAVVTTTNCVGQMKSNLTLSTYDVQELNLAECTKPNCVEITVTFALHSRARGTLLILLLTHGQVDLRGAVFLLLRRSDSDGVVREVSSIGAGEYRALAYDIEWDGTIHSGTPATRRVVSVTQDSARNTSEVRRSSNIRSCRIASQSSTITVSCTYASDSTSTSRGFMCVLQDARNVEDLVTAYLTGASSELVFSPVVAGHYLVTVLPLLREPPTLSSLGPETIVGSAAVHVEHVVVVAEVMAVEAEQISSLPSLWIGVICSLAFFAIGVLLGVFVTIAGCACRRNKTRRGRSRSSILSQDGGQIACPVYEDIGPQMAVAAVNKTLFELEKNAAYGHVEKVKLR